VAIRECVLGCRFVIKRVDHGVVCGVKLSLAGWVSFDNPKLSVDQPQ